MLAREYGRKKYENETENNSVGAPMDLMNSRAKEFKIISSGLLVPNTIQRLVNKQKQSMRSSDEVSI